MSVMIDTAPTEFECTDETGELIFKISTFDAHCAVLEIKTMISPANWPLISAEIMHCITSMKLDRPIVSEKFMQGREDKDKL